MPAPNWCPLCGRRPNDPMAKLCPHEFHRQGTKMFVGDTLVGVRVDDAPPEECTCPSGDGSLRWPCPVHPSEAQREFNGDTSHLISCIESLLRLDEAGVLTPHGLGGHARTLLIAAAKRLAQQPAPEEADELRGAVVRGWCSPENSHKVMDVELAEAIVKEVAALAQQSTSHPSIIHCKNCGCDWVDNGLNPVGCPYCDKNVIRLTQAEIQSGLDRVSWAEGLIRQLPPDHGGRNTWLRNYSESWKKQDGPSAEACNPASQLWSAIHDAHEAAGEECTVSLAHVATALEAVANRQEKRGGE